MSSAAPARAPWRPRVIYFAASDCRMMWAAGAVAAMSSITFPAVSALVSRTADADQQGELTSISGDCVKTTAVMSWTPRATLVPFY